MKLKSLKIFSRAAAFSLGFLLPALCVYAADYVPLAPITGTVSATGSTNLSTYLTGIFKVGIAAAAALAFIRIVWGGFVYLSTDAITGKEEGKEKIGRALGGLVLALAAYIILNTINPQLVNLNLNFGTAANKATDINAPSSQTYESQLDQTISDINKNLDATKAQATAIETTASAEQDTLDSLYYDGAITKEEYDAGQLKINALKAQAQAIRDYNTTVDALSLHRLNGITYASSNSADAQSQAEQTLTTIDNNENTAVQKLTNAETADQAGASKYTAWIGDVEGKEDAARLAIDQADIGKGNVGVAKYVIDKAYSDAKTAADNAGSNQALIDAINARRDALVTAVHRACDQADRLLSCRNYTPATGH